jgi:membrane protease YdiL (CAAX protease family)
MRAYSPAAAIITQAVLCAAVHGQPLQIAYVLAGGILLGLVFHWTRSLPAVILCHIAFNATGLIVGSLDEAYYGVVGLLFIASGPALFFILRDLYRNRASLSNEPASDD